MLPMMGGAGMGQQGPGAMLGGLAAQPPPQPGMGGPQEPEDMAGQIAKLAMAMISNPQTAQGLALATVMPQIQKMYKAERTVPAMANKMTATTPFSAPVGRADQAALGQMMAARAQGMAPGGGPPGAGMGGGMPQAGGMPGGMPQGPGGLLAMLAARGGGGMPGGGMG